MRFSLLMTSGLVLAGCSFDENLPIENLFGTVVLPEDAATRTIVVDGIEDTVTDVRLIGPVVLGLYPDISDSIFQYTHPVIGPSFQDGNPGDTFPYGGTTIGDIRFACLQELNCRVSSGRYVNYDEIVDWQARVGQPIEDAFGDTVTSGEYLRQVCFDILEASSDDEVRIIATEDRNGDDVIDNGDLDFVQRTDGQWEAEFIIWQQEYFEDLENGGGFTLWGWMDSPSDEVYGFETCLPTNGFQDQEYNVAVDGGRQGRDLLNRPSDYIQEGDWVSQEGFQYQSVNDIAELQIGFQVEDL
ncbi:MAG: hypothetical protein ACJATT_000881 [Myxococcota bacterium]|jgi:hypothetical protein